MTNHNKKLSYNEYVGGTYFAADGGGYAIKIVGINEETSDFLVLGIGKNGNVLDESPRKLDCFKASYRYIFDPDPVKEAEIAEKNNLCNIFLKAKEEWVKNPNPGSWDAYKNAETNLNNYFKDY